MSLIRQIWLLLLGTLLLALVGSVGVTAVSTRDALQAQLQLKNNDNAAALALALSQQQGDQALMSLLMSAQFDTGAYRSLRYTATDGGRLFQRDADRSTQAAPAWFKRLLRIDAAPGVAQVSDGWRALGRVELVSESAYAYDALWRGSLQATGALAAIGALAGWMALWLVSRIRRPLDRTVEQARSLERGEYLTLSEPGVPELRRLTRAMNSMVARLKLAFEGQAAQVETLRVQATCDVLTGLSNRKHFIGQLSASLQREDGTAEGGLVLLRLVQLAEVNRQLGHASTDRLIQAISQALQNYSRLVHNCHVGRLNGSDFALALSAGGLARETAQALSDVLRVVLPNFGAHLSVAAGAVEIHQGAAVATLMSAADLALARAESRGGFAVEVDPHVPGALTLKGGEAWYSLIRNALDESRIRLASYPVLGVSQALIHLECPLRLQIDPNGAFEPAAIWLPLALRSRLTSIIDERAVVLALADIARDGQPRCVNLAPASLKDGALPARLRALLQQSPRAARQLWIEVAEIAAVEHFDLLRELSRQLRPFGVRVGLEHAGERLARIDRLFELGLDYVKLDASVTLAVGGDVGRAGFVKGLVTMLHTLSLQVHAEGVVSADDAQALWDCGVDGLTGPWVSARANDAPTSP